MKKFITTYSRYLIGALVLGVALTGVIFAQSQSREDFITSFTSGFLRAAWHDDHTHPDQVFYYGYGFSGKNQQWGYGYGYSDKDADKRPDENLNNYGFAGSDGAATIVSVVTTQTTAKIIYSTPYLARFAWGYASGTPVTGENYLGGEDNNIDYFSGPRTVNIDKLTCGATYYFLIVARDSASNHWEKEVPFTTQSCNSGQSSGSYLPSAPFVPVHGVVNPEIPKVSRLMFGDQGSTSKQLQQLLNKLGFMVSVTGAGSPGHETSFFGPKTKAALKKFQAAHGLNPDGVYGPFTQKALATALK